MIRSTQNESISSFSKRKLIANTTNNYTGILGESLEAVLAGPTEENAIVVNRREVGVHLAFQTTTPSNAFNGSYE